MNAQIPVASTIAPVGPAVAPFWLWLPSFFLLPLAPALLLRIVVLAAIPAVAMALAALGSAGVGGWIVVGAVIVLSVAAGIAAGYRIIERSAQGFLQPSQYAQADDGGTVVGALQLVVLYLGLAAAAFAVLLASGGSRVLFWISGFLLFVLVAPAAVLRLVASRNLGVALNPAGIGATVVDIGLSYFGLCALVFGIEVLRSFAMPALAAWGATTMGLAIGSLAGAWAGLSAGLLALVFLIGATFWYLSFVQCALLGYAAYQYAELLDIVVVGPGARDNGMRASTSGVDLVRRRRDAVIAKLVADGDIGVAIEQINDELRERPNDLSLHARLHKLLLREGNTARIENHTERCIDLFMRTDNVIETVALVADAIHRNTHWQPRDAAQGVSLARAALELGQTEVAVHLIRGFDKRYPRHPELPTVYVIGALTMLQTGAATQTVAQLLEHVAMAYPEHPAAAEALRYLQRLPDDGAAPAADPAAAVKGASI